MQEYLINKYTIFKEYDDSIIGANLSMNILFSLDRDKYDLLNKYSDRLSVLEKENPIFYSTMLKLGVIEKEDKNAYYEFLLFNRLQIFNNNTYRITINPTLNCNCNCWYCYEEHSKKVMNKQLINSIVSFANNLIHHKGIKKIYLDWFGGEPLLCYKNRIIPIASAIKELCDNNNVEFESGITTNGYLIKKDMISFFHNINMVSIQITLDGYKNFHDRVRKHNNKPTFDKIVSNICLLAEKLKPENLSLRINTTKENFESITKIADHFPEEIRPNIKILLQQVWQDKDISNLSFEDIEEKKKSFRNAGFKVNEEIFNMKGYVCYADLYNQAVINYDGRIFKCTARDFNNDIEDGVLKKSGDITWNTSRLSRYISKATFENEQCKSCTYLPVCFGFCSKKVALLSGNIEQFNQYCHKSGLEQTLNYVMKEFAKSNLPISFIQNTE